MDDCQRRAVTKIAYLLPLSVGLSVRKVYCGKTADWIWMPFGVLSAVGRGMGVLNGGQCAVRRRGGFGGLSFPLVSITVLLFVLRVLYLYHAALQQTTDINKIF